LERSLDSRALGEISGLTIGQLKQILVGASAAEWLQHYRNGLRSEAIAAVVKVMSEGELSSVARAVFNEPDGHRSAEASGSTGLRPADASRSTGLHSAYASRSTGTGPRPGDAVAIGSPQHFGSRIQPNSPGDDEDEILLSILEGLTYGCGDVI